MPSDKQSATTTGRVTELLGRWQAGDMASRDRLVVLIYDDLRRMARRQLRHDARLSLRPTELVHETFMKLVSQDHVAGTSRAHFLAIAATAMRQIAIDFARRRIAAKRNGGVRVTLTDNLSATAQESDHDIESLHLALRQLAQIEPRHARIVEMHYFGGMSSDEIAEVVGCAPITVKRSWRTARAWLHAHMSGGVAGDA